MLRGWHWLGPQPGLLLVALLAGTLKSLFLLDRISRRCLHRIALFDDNTCLGAVYSWKSWLLVPAMIAMGVVARHLWAPGPVPAILYLAIGWALLVSSRVGWRFFWQTR